MVGAVISARLATINELQTLLGVEDLYLLIEVLAVDNQNRRIAHLIAEERSKNR